MSPNQKRFKIVSLVILLVALVQVVSGVLLLLGSPLVAGLRIDLRGDASYDGAIAAEVLGVLALVVGGRAQLHDLADVECAVGGLLCDGFVDGRLESLDVEGDVGLTDLADLSAGQLQVVRLRSGLGELNDRDLVTTDLLGQPLEGVDTGDHGEVRIGGGDARVVRCVTVVCAGRE